MMEINYSKDFYGKLNSIYDDVNTIKGFQDIFDPMAKYVLGNLAIEIGHIKYSFLEIEFYYCNKHLEKEETFKRTYKRDCQAGEFFIHYSGLDFCFATGKDKQSYGGILIRSLLKYGSKDNIIISGPLRCANELINQCFKNTTKPHPRLVEFENEKMGNVYATIRQGIETGKPFDKLRKNYLNHQIPEDKFPRFAYYIEGITWPNDYSANPSKDYKKEIGETRGLYSIPI